MKLPQATFQIGKNGVTDGTIQLLKTAFLKREQIKLSVLKAGGHDKEKVKQMGGKIIDELGKNYTFKTLGFTIFVRKWRKVKR